MTDVGHPSRPDSRYLPSATTFTTSDSGGRPTAYLLPVFQTLLTSLTEITYLEKLTKNLTPASCAYSACPLYLKGRGWAPLSL